MNGPIRRVSVVIMLMFLALMVNASYAYVFRTQSLNNDPANRRVRDAEFGTDRGDILVGNTPIVTSTPVDDRFGFQRSYLQAELYAPVTGYYSFLLGGSGLERYYSSQLAGTSDVQFLQNIVDLATGKRPQGASLETTLDARAQQAAANALGDRPGAVVALDYSTGAVLAMVTSPTYDPNRLASHDIAATQEAWTALNDDPAKPLVNRAAREVYAPGSTFKLVVSAAALDQAFVGRAPATFFWACLPYRTEWRYAEASHKVIALDAGHICQNLYLAAGAIGCGTCAVAAYDQPRADALLGLDGTDEFVIYLAPVGKVR